MREDTTTAILGPAALLGPMPETADTGYLLTRGSSVLLHRPATWAVRIGKVACLDDSFHTQRLA